MGWHDAVGLTGVALILLAYLGLQADRLRPEQPAYSLMNALGAAAVLLSLAVDFNLSAFVIEAFWLAISIYGLLRVRRKRNPDGSV